MAKIAIDCRMIECAGIGRVIKNFSQLLSKSEYSLILLGFEKDKERLASFNPKEILFLKSPIYSISEQLELPRKIPLCDLFWSPHFNIPLLPIRAKKRLVTIHDVYHLAHLSEFSIPERVYAKLFYSMATHLSDAVTTVSIFSKEEIVRLAGAKREKVNVFHNIVSPSLFSPCNDEKRRESIRKKYALPEKYILAIGNVKKHKNLKRLLAAFKGIECEEKMVIVGKREGFINQDKEISSLKSERVLFTGEVEDNELSSIYSMATLLAFPSLYEGFGFPPVEAMACGCPVVASNATSIPEVCGEAVFYVDPLDVNSIREGIKTLLFNEKKREELIEKGITRAKDFNLEKIGNEFLSFIRGLAS